MQVCAYSNLSKQADILHQWKSLKHEILIEKEIIFTNTMSMGIDLIESYEEGY